MGTGMDLCCLGLCHQDLTTGVDAVRGNPKGTAKSQEKAVHRVLGPSGTEAGPAIKVPLKLVTWER